MRLLAKFDGSLGELVDALAALEAVSETAKASIYVAPSDRSLDNILRSTWFVRDVVDINADPASYDAVCELRADRDKARDTEMNYREARKEQIDALIADMAAKTGVDPEKIAKPPDYPMLSSTDPLWSRIMGYQLAVRAQAGADGPLLALKEPHLPKVKGLKERTNRYLHSVRDRIRPGVPYVVVADPALLSHYRVRIPRPQGWEAVVVGDDADAETVLGIVTNPRCKAVFSRVGGLSHVGWAAGTPMVVEFTRTPDLAYWEAVRSPRCINIDLTSEQTTTDSIVFTLAGLYRELLGESIDHAPGAMEAA